VVYRFVGVFAAGTAVDFLENTVFGSYINPFVTHALDSVLATVGPSTGTGAVATRFVRDLLIGPYGLITVACTYAFAIIFPIVTAFFLAFSVLEDSGYLPRLAVIVNRSFRAMGLNGKAVLPMVLGLGCDTMATLTARIMETPRSVCWSPCCWRLAYRVPLNSASFSASSARCRSGRRWCGLGWWLASVLGWISSGPSTARAAFRFDTRSATIRRPQLSNTSSRPWVVWSGT